MSIPNSVEETIKQLRSRILQAMGRWTGKFTSDIKSPQKGAEFTSGHAKSWSSLLYEWDTIGIYLKFDIKNYDDAQKITLHENEFGAVRLALYDDEEIKNFSIRITKGELFQKLGAQLPNEGIYTIEDCNSNFRKRLGHVLVLRLKDTGENWSIQSSDQLEKASADLVEKVAATLKVLLPVAEHYAENREAILAGK